MKTDLYTKTVLTVIALALLLIAFKNESLGTMAKADPISLSKRNTEVVHVIIDDVDQYAFTYCTVPVEVRK